MQHTFASSEGPVEVTLARDGEAFVLEGQRFPTAWVALK